LSGVLHHLLDPDEGLLALRSVLKRDGAMQIMVYGSYGRTGIYMIRGYCHVLGIATSSKELLDLRATLQALPANHPMAHLLGKNKDYEHPDALADAILHPKDRAFSVPQIYTWLDRCGMSFGRWIEQAPFFHNAGYWHGRRIRRCSTSCLKARSMRPSNSFEERLRNTSLLLIAVIEHKANTPFNSVASSGLLVFPFACRGPCVIETAFPLALWRSC